MHNTDNYKWNDLVGAYKAKYNPLPILQKLEANKDVKRCWEELWQELHHQGDIDDASYASLVKLVEIQEKNAQFDWNFYALVGTIEIERFRKTNPKVPSWLLSDYKESLSKLFLIAQRDLPQAQDTLLIRSIIAILALSKKQYSLAVMILYSDNSEINEFVNERNYWNELYNSGKDM